MSHSAFFFSEKLFLIHLNHQIYLAFVSKDYLYI
jgi:hypothetical protein